MDSSACNFDPAVNVNDNTCEFAENFTIAMTVARMTWTTMESVMNWKLWGARTHCNYSETTDSDGSCAFAEEFYNCNGSCTNDMDNDGVCDELEIQGADRFALILTRRHR